MQRQPQALAHDAVEALFLHRDGHLVDVVRVLGGDDRAGRDAPEQGDLLAHALVKRPVRAQHQHIRLDSDAPELVHRVLGRLGLELTGHLEERHEGDVHERHPVAPHVVAQLADGLEEGQRLDVAHGATDLHDHDVGIRRRRPLRDARLDLVGDMRDHLHGRAQEVPAALAADDGVVHGAGGDVGGPGERLVREALVVAQVQVGLGAVLRHEYLAVLERAHRPGVHVQVRIALQQRYPVPACLEERAERCGRDPLTQAGDDAPGYEDVVPTVFTHCPASPTRTPYGPSAYRPPRRGPRHGRGYPARRARSSAAWARAAPSVGSAPSMRHISSTSASPSTASMVVIARPSSAVPFTSR